MAGNSIGLLFKLSTFGESHGPAIGGVLDGCPAGIDLAEADIQRELDRRKPGQSKISTQRQETDQVELLSGIFEGKTTGTPIGFIIRNRDHRSSDYDKLKDVYRPSHADLTWEKKFGFRDHRGGGRSSARETACRVAGGAIAKKLLDQLGIEISAWVSQVGEIKLEGNGPFSPDSIESSIVRCPDQQVSERMIEFIEGVRNEGDSVGGKVTATVTNAPIGLGEPVFQKLHAELGSALFSINAVKAVEFGSGIQAASMLGSEHNDPFVGRSEGISTKTNHSGGIQGGISNGQDISIQISFKPVATIGKVQNTVDKEGKEVTLEAKGRHDPCVVPRAVPIVESMIALVLADMVLLSRSNKI